MNFKIEMGVLNITNYPLVAKHFEDMAEKGWLIHKIVLENIFIYKKIQPERLDFSISPYEVETAFTKKTKEELKEFQSVCESVGWNYASKLGDLHIYYKEKGSQAVDLETDEEVEFSTIEKIANKRLVGMYFLIVGTIFINWFMFFESFDGVLWMRDGMIQAITPLFPIFLILGIIETIKIKNFLKTNKKNIELGGKIEYKDSKFYFGKLIFILGFYISIVFISHIVYTGIILKNTSNLTSVLPIFIAFSIANIFRILVKPSRTDSSGKKMWFFIGAITILIMVPLINGATAQRIIGSYNNLDPDKYKVLTPKDFGGKEKTYDAREGKILQDLSFLVPKSYEYSSYDEEDSYIETEYSQVVTEDLAKTLVNQYIKRSKDSSEYFTNKYQSKPVFSIEEDEENLWNLDEVYYLNYDKTEIVIRDGKEVFYLQGKDFTDPDIVKITKNRLGL